MSQASTTPATTSPASIFRFEVAPKDSQPDPQGSHRLAQANEFLAETPITAIHTKKIYLIQAPITPDQAQQIAHQLLTDPVCQEVNPQAKPVAPQHVIIEVHYQPGVMDPAAMSTRDAIIEMFPHLTPEQVAVRTGIRYDLQYTQNPPTQQALNHLATKALANTVIQEIHLKPFTPDAFPVAHHYKLNITHVNITDLDEQGLKTLSRQGHLFLSLDEMKAIQDYYKQADRQPTDIELETLAQTWSEHCVHKTLKSTVRYSEENTLGASIPGFNATIAQRPGHTLNQDGSVTIQNILKSTIAAATFKLMETAPHNQWCVSVFEDNAGIIAFDQEDAVCIKVETHNHPSALEPYGGAATGIGGCIRDIMGTGLFAKPFANTNNFAVADPNANSKELPNNVIHPKRTLQQVTAGIKDYGNRMGIPTCNGSVFFHDDFVGNPLVFAGSVGLLPLDKCFGTAQPGDRIIALGGATGRDGIHGATFSSAELTDTHADEFSHAVQIGNAITQKKTLDVILQARDHHTGTLFTAITDCGAGGFSSAIGEMGEKVGAIVDLDQAPLKYDGLTYTEIWISEAQERMVLAVPQDKIQTLKELCQAEEVEFSDLGRFGYQNDQNQPELILKYQNQQVGKLSMHLMHNGIPSPQRDATWAPTYPTQKASGLALSASAIPTQSNGQINLQTALHTLLGHPNIASKHWIIKQYDHEVQGGSVIKPLTGPNQDGPSDGAVIRPKLNSNKAISLASGLQPNLSEKTTHGDSYWATLAAIDEAIRNSICVGADPTRIAILDNFCWPSCDKPQNMGSLVRASIACYDGALAYKTPFISGKDSLNNQFTTEDGKLITIPQTLLITALGIVQDASLARTMDAKSPDNPLIIVGQTSSALGGSHLLNMTQDTTRNTQVPHLDLVQGPANAHAVAKLISNQLVQSAHDCSDGGILVAAAEMAFAGQLGLTLNLSQVPTDRNLDNVTAAFAETPSRYLLEISPENLDAVTRSLREANIPFAQIGTFNSSTAFTVSSDSTGTIFQSELEGLKQAWLAPLDW